MSCPECGSGIENCVMCLSVGDDKPHHNMSDNPQVLNCVCGKTQQVCKQCLDDGLITKCWECMQADYFAPVLHGIDNHLLDVFNDEVIGDDCLELQTLDEALSLMHATAKQCLLNSNYPVEETEGILQDEQVQDAIKRKALQLYAAHH